MIVAIDVTTLRGRISGVGHYTAEIVEHMARSVGRDVSELLLLSNGPVDYVLPSSARLVHGFQFPIRSIWMQFLLPLLLKKIRPDIVHYTNYLAPAVLAGDYVVSVHDMSLTRTPAHHTLKKRLLTASLVPRVARKARLVLTPSQATRADVVSDLGISADRVLSIPYAAAERFTRVAERPTYPGLDHPYFLFVGTIEPRKNLVRLIDAFAAFARDVLDVRLVLAGQRGWKCDEIYARARRPDVAARTVILDYVEESSLPSLYSHALACVYPSLFEGFGFPVVEAMACGTPVLTSNTTSLAEIGEGAALLVDPTDVGAISNGLRHLAGSRSLREELRLKGLERVAAFSWEETARLTVAAYRQALRPQRLLDSPRDARSDRG
ncbi:MAG: glycosyltransferase family 4 protein [Vicinamibacteria bacterium]|nr:glycosyltransferase family 4 protein [Vicinamibacteria bacterium]